MSQELRLEPIEFLKWYGIIVSIPQSWRRAIRDSSSIEVDREVMSEHNIGLFKEKQFFNLKSISSTLVCKAHIQSIAKYPTSEIYFSEKYGIGNEECEKIYLLPGLVTLDTKTRIFQYKILNNILYLNNRQ